MGLVFEFRDADRGQVPVSLDKVMCVSVDAPTTSFDNH